MKPPLDQSASLLRGTMTRERLIYWLVALWCVLCLALVFSFTFSKSRDFDADGTFIQYSAATDFDQAFSGWLSAEVGELKNKVVHFSQGNCTCEWIAQSHIHSVKLLAEQQGKTNLQLDISGLPEMTKRLPVTPAVAVYDQHGQLTYLGPYATGFFCSAGQGLVETFIKQSHGETGYGGATIPLDANGCYCGIK